MPEHLLIKTKEIFGCNNIRIRTLHKKPNIHEEIQIQSFQHEWIYSRTEVSLISTCDKKVFIMFNPENNGCIYYEYKGCGSNIPLFTYFTSESTSSQKYDDLSLETYTMFIVYRDKIVKLRLSKENCGVIEFESCNVHKIPLFNCNPDIKFRKHVFGLLPGVEHRMQGLAEYIGHDENTFIDVVKFNFNLKDSENIVNITWNFSIKMPFRLQINDVSVEQIWFFFTGTIYCCGVDEPLSIVIDCESCEYNTNPLSCSDDGSQCILIYQKGHQTVLVHENDEDKKSRIEIAEYTRIGALIVSCKRNDFLNSLKKYNRYTSQPDESDEGE